MKIGIIALGKFKKSEGGTTVLRGLIKHLPLLDKDKEYFIITCKDSQIPNWLDKKYDNLKIIYLKCFDFNIVQRFLEMFLIPMFVSSYKIDTFICPNNYSVMLTKKQVYLIFQRRLFYFKNLDSFTRLFKNLLLQLSLKKASKIFVASEFHRDTLLKNTSLSPQKIKVSYLGVDIPTPQKSKRFDSLVDWKNNKIGLFVSVLRPYKNVELLIKTMSILKNKYHLNDFKIAVIGNFPIGKYKNINGYKRKIEDLIHRFHLEEDVIFVGYLPYEEVIYSYTKSDIFLFPTKFEGFGLPLIESMKIGIPVVASNIPVMREIADNAALLIDPDDPEAWAYWINELLNKDDLRDDLIIKGKKRAEQFTWYNFVKVIFEEIKEQ